MSTLLEKLALLADAAKYDASCASSGATRRDSTQGKGVGSAGGMGICHSYAPDGRCISLLKLLLTNRCLYDCHYCINRRSSNVRRAAFTSQEVVRLTLDFYKRNYIEGLFLSSGIVRSADHTMEQLVEVARTLREDHDFRGYIHLKTIPEASPGLIEKAARFADRISLNLELPVQESLDRFAPEKNLARTKQAMGRIRLRLDEAADRRKNGDRSLRHATGQSTQVIVGADASTDADFLARSEELYQSYRLRRVYYSAFSPIPEPSAILPAKPAPLLREHRLYQADWLMRFYGFQRSEITSASQPNLDLHLDPKLAWALRHREQFPLDLRTATREQLLRIPGLGPRNVDRLLAIRRHAPIRLIDLARLRVSLDKVRPFLITADHRPPAAELDSDRLLARFAPKPEQLELFC
ncbi:putative DNA modification/repair radical SAM protein [Haloferula luteola]|uniref:Putative DNA modification/repair radical SAM protein n=1 Tax=Haloferula luteola TaxID=595692 RepID=A0A840UZI6_9BACT|nr:putative DNA modification/repair radical SAM protein [Haloferula luteola]MBB5350403.1 putative DNA modification/repair radical SAM protein [Haloferula luteola]